MKQEFLQATAGSSHLAWVESQFTQLTEVAPQWLVLIVVVVVAINFIGRTLSEASESWARVLGPLGRRWRERGLRRQEARKELSESRALDLEDMKRQRDYLGEQLESCRSEHEPKDAYIQYDAHWHRDISLRAIEAGCEVPEHLSFLRWRAQNT